MNEDHEHTQSSLMNTSILSNKRSNFQFTYDSETNLLLLIHKYKEDIFTRGNIIKTWEKVLQEFNEQYNANIIQSRTINHRFQILKKNLENRLKHENQPLDQLSLNENEKLLIDIIDYMYKNNYTDVNPYSLGGGVISANEQMHHTSTSAIQSQHQHHLSTTDITQISPNTFTNKLNQERAQYLMSQEFDQSVNQFQSGMGISHAIQQQTQPQPQSQPQPQPQPQTQQQLAASTSSSHLQQHPSSHQISISKDIVPGFPPPLAQSEMIDDTSRLPTQAGALIQISSHSSPQMMYKSDVNLSSTTLQQDHIAVQSEPAHSSRHLATPQLPHSQPDQQIQQDPLIEHRSRQLSTSQLSPTIHYDTSPQQHAEQQQQHHHPQQHQHQHQHHHHHPQQQQSSINYTYTLNPQLSQHHSTDTQEPSVTFLLQQLLVSQNQVSLSINALRDDLRNFKVQTYQRIDDLINAQQLQNNNRIYEKLDTLIEMLRNRSLKSNSSSSGDDEMTQEDHSGNSHEQTTSSE